MDRGLDDQLPQFFDAAEEALDRELSLRLERQVRHDEQRRQFAAATANAHAKAKHERLAGIAREQADSWRAAQELRQYAEALRAAATDPDAAAWAQWVHAHADETDPLSSPVGHPLDREPTWVELARHLPGGYY